MTDTADVASVKASSGRAAIEGGPLFRSMSRVDRLKTHVYQIASSRGLRLHGRARRAL